MRRASFSCLTVLCLTAHCLTVLCLTVLCLTPTPAMGAESPPDVLLITVDTLRPDALGWVAGRNATPALDRLAAEGFRFPRAVSPAPLTSPAHVSILSGLIPPRHGVRDNGQVLGAAPLLLAESLRAAGYRTAAFVSGYPLKGFFGLARGFDHYDDEVRDGEGAWLERRADATTTAALAWAESAKKPFFLWVHYYDPHLPYDPPAGDVRPGPRGAYDGEVAVVDRAVGRLRGALGESATLTVFAADHGESLGEHGEGTHGFFIYESTVLVPMVVHFPGRVPAGESRAAARLVDIAPTILDLLGLPSMPDIDGVSLAPTLRGAAQKIPPAYSETRQPWTSYGWSPLRAVRGDDWKLIAAPKPELYDLSRDPGEERNLVTEERAEARRLKALLDEIEARPVVSAGAAHAEAADDAATLAALRALGYVGGGASVDEPGPGLADPKDRIALREILTEADELLRRGDPRGALAKFDAVLAQESDNRFAVSRSGEALLRAGDLASAIERLRQAAKLDPRRPEVRDLLAEALTRAGRSEEAIEQWMELIRLQPGQARAWSNLGAALGKAGRAKEAAEAYAKAVELEPGNPDRLTRSALAERAAGRVDVAVAQLLEVLALTGEERFAHSGALGILLADLGRGDEARTHLARSRPQEGDYAAARWRLALLEIAAGRREPARRALREAIAAAPHLRAAASADPRLASLVDEPG